MECGELLSEISLHGPFTFSDSCKTPDSVQDIITFPPCIVTLIFAGLTSTIAIGGIHLSFPNTI